MSERVTGYSLLGIGIIVMIFATIQIISVFTGKAEPIPLFQYEKTTEKESQGSSFNPTDILNQLQGGSGSELEGMGMPNVELIDPDVLNDILNLTVYYLIMQFLLGLGFKLASLGVQLIRPIHVHMKNRDFESKESPPNQTTST